MAIAATRIQVGQDRRALDPAKGFRTHTEFLGAVMGAHTGRGVDERLRPLAAAGSDEMGAHNDPLGGFLLPEAWSPEMLAVEPEEDPAVGRTRPVTMDAPTLHINARVDKDHATSVSGGLIVTRHVETTPLADSRMVMEKIRLEAHDLFGFSKATNEIVTDSAVTFMELLASGFRDESAAHMLEERVRGTGAGEFLGILNSPCLITVDKESGQTAATIVADNVINMRRRCWGYRRARVDRDLRRDRAADEADNSRRRRGAAHSDLAVREGRQARHPTRPAHLLSRGRVGARQPGRSDARELARVPRCHVHALPGHQQHARPLRPPGDRVQVLDAQRWPAALANTADTAALVADPQSVRDARSARVEGEIRNHVLE